MSNANTNEEFEENKENPERMFTAVTGVSTQLEAIETFIKRRFDELSMEINATAQQVDMAEEGIAKRFTEILEVLHAVSYSGDGTSSANTGVELEAVVEMTEQAANKILDSADRIADRLQESEKWEEDKQARTQNLNDISEDVEKILMACSFQDLTGQRIKKTLENLKSIEGRLSTALEKMGIEVHPDITDKVEKASSQDDIDALFQEAKE